MPETLELSTIIGNIVNRFFFCPRYASQRYRALTLSPVVVKVCRRLRLQVFPICLSTLKSDDNRCLPMAVTSHQYFPQYYHHHLFSPILPLPYLYDQILQKKIQCLLLWNTNLQTSILQLLLCIRFTWAGLRHCIF